MTDAELIARLRYEANTDGYDYHGDLHEKSADRIEALTKERDEQIEWVKRLADDLISAEAKLAKAVEVLNALDATLDRNGWHVDSIAREDIRATLAEIKSGVATTPYGLEGESHD